MNDPQIWHYIKTGFADDQTVGPLTAAQIIALVRKGEIIKATKIYGGEAWAPAENYPWVAKELAAVKERALAAKQQAQAEKVKKREDAQREKVEKAEQKRTGDERKKQQRVSDQESESAQRESRRVSTPRRYPAMSIIISIWKILSLLALVVWALGFLGLTVVTLMSIGDLGIAAVIFNGLAFLWLSLATLLPALVCYATAESMQVILDIQDNTFRAALRA